jgi:hypothetical protein
MDPRTAWGSELGLRPLTASARFHFLFCSFHFFFHFFFCVESFEI